MSIQFKKAQRRQTKLRLGITGPAGSGKSCSALKIALGIGGPIAFIDTERGSGEVYSQLGDYDICTLTAPFTPNKYIEAIKVAEASGYDVIIIDSLSQAWNGVGGLLDMHSAAIDKSSNSYAAWRQVNPSHNALLDAIMQCKCHLIATMRSKTEHVQDIENGHTVIKKLAVSPVQREGVEHEFGVFLELDHHHLATATKDLTGLFDGQVFKSTVGTGKMLANWLAGEQQAPQPVAVPSTPNALDNTNTVAGANPAQILSALVHSKPGTKWI